MRIIRSNQNRKNFLLPLIYVSGWILPVLLALCVASSGHYFSHIGMFWQLENITLISLTSILASISILLNSLSVSSVINPLVKTGGFDTDKRYIVDKIIIGGLVVISGYGLFYSFGGAFFENNYEGPVRIWLGYGAWSVAFLMSLFLFICDYLRERRFRLGLVGLYLAITFPFLLCGSRVDFVSGMIGMLVLCFSDTRNRWSMRLLQLTIIVTITIQLAFAIGLVRASSYDNGIIPLT